MTDTNKTDLTPERLEKLRALANAAAPDSTAVFVDAGNKIGVIALDGTMRGIAEVEFDRDEDRALFVAAANFVLALVDEVERLRALLAACAKSPGYAACLRECKEDHQ